MTTPTLTPREALEDADATIAALLGYCSDQTSTAKDAIATLAAIRAALTAQPEFPEPVAEITSVDEYGPCLGWHTHWVNYPVGTKLYTATHLQQFTRVDGVTTDGLLETLYAIGNFLEIDYEEARKAPGKPSDVYKSAIASKVDKAVEQKEKVTNEWRRLALQFDGHRMQATCK